MRLKKGPKKVIKTLLLLLVLITVGLSIYYFKFLNNGVKENKIISEIKEYGYVLRSNKSNQYKKMFYELTDILKKDTVDEKKYVKQISKMFIFDFYSLNEKVAKTDIGGTDFVYQEIFDNFIENAQDTIYKYVESNIYGQRKQKDLPTVNSVTIENMEQKSYTFGDKEDEEAYFVTVKWTYTDKNNGYQDQAKLVFIHDGIKLSLVELTNNTE